MHAREDAVSSRLARAAAAALVLLSTPGCGAIFHASQTVTITVPPDAQVYQSGTKMTEVEKGKYTTMVFLNNQLGQQVVVAKGSHVAKIELERHVDAAAIVCDVLWSLTIVGLAAPISDGILGTFVKTRSEVTVGALEPYPATDNPLPVYAVAGERITASEAPIAAPTPPPAPEPPPPPAPEPPPPPKKGAKR